MLTGSNCFSFYAENTDNFTLGSNETFRKSSAGITTLNLCNVLMPARNMQVL